MLKRVMWFVGGFVFPIITMHFITKLLDFFGVPLMETFIKSAAVLILMVAIVCLVAGEKILRWPNGKHALAGMLCSIIIFTTFFLYGWGLVVSH